MITPFSHARCVSGRGLTCNAAWQVFDFNLVRSKVSQRRLHCWYLALVSSASVWVMINETRVEAIRMMVIGERLSRVGLRMIE